MNVRTGEQFLQVLRLAHYAPRWEVRSVMNPQWSVPHAQLVNLDDPDDVRTVSCLALRDRRYFRPIVTLEPTKEASHSEGARLRQLPATP